MVKIEEEIHKAIRGISSRVGEYLAEQFDIECCSRIWDGQVASPIEQLFLVGLRGACVLSGETEPPDVGEYMGMGFMEGTEIRTQVEIGPYRVDFLVTHGMLKQGRHDDRKQVIVECDSQQFHERDEAERRYEKKRARYLTGMGYRSLHFTGKEIKADPVGVGFEVLSLLTGRKIEAISCELD